MVESAWGSLEWPTSLGQLSTNIGKMSTRMQEWGRSSFGSVRQELARLRGELENVRKSFFLSGPRRRERHLMTKMFELLSREECMEQQRSHQARSYRVLCCEGFLEGC